MIPSIGAMIYLAGVGAALWFSRPKSRFTIHVRQGWVEREIDSASLIRVLARKRAVND